MVRPHQPRRSIPSPFPFSFFPLPYPFPVQPYTVKEKGPTSQAHRGERASSAPKAHSHHHPLLTLGIPMSPAMGDDGGATGTEVGAGSGGGGTAATDESGSKPPLEEQLSSRLRVDDDMMSTTALPPPHHARSPSGSTLIPLPPRDDKSIHHRPRHGTGAKVYHTSQRDEAHESDASESTAPSSPKMADAETKAAVRSAREDHPICLGELPKDAAGHPDAKAPPTSGHAISAARLAGLFNAAGSHGIGTTGGGPMSSPAMSGAASAGTTAPATPSSMTRENSSYSLHRADQALTPALESTIAGTPPPASPAVPPHEPADKQAPVAPKSAKRPTLAKSDPKPAGDVRVRPRPLALLDASNEGLTPDRRQQPSVQERKSVFGKLFDKKDPSAKTLGSAGSAPGATGPASGGSYESGAESDGGYASARSATGMLNRKASAKAATAAAKSAHVNGAEVDEHGAPMARQPSTGARSTSAGRTPSEKGADEKSHKFRDMVAMAPKLVRKPSSSKGGRSDDGRSDDGGNTTAGGESRSRAGSQATTSLLKKYGVCEKAAIGKGATAVVRLAHKWDRGTDKLYAVKEFRKRRKNETEKEYVKKLTSEFCISSTLSVVLLVAGVSAKLTSGGAGITRTWSRRSTSSRTRTTTGAR